MKFSEVTNKQILESVSYKQIVESRLTEDEKKEALEQLSSLRDMDIKVSPEHFKGHAQETSLLCFFDWRESDQGADFWYRIFKERV